MGWFSDISSSIRSVPLVGKALWEGTRPIEMITKPFIGAEKAGKLHEISNIGTAIAGAYLGGTAAMGTGGGAVSLDGTVGGLGGGFGGLGAGTGTGAAAAGGTAAGGGFLSSAAPYIAGTSLLGALYGQKKAGEEQKGAMERYLESSQWTPERRSEMMKGVMGDVSKYISGIKQSAGKGAAGAGRGGGSYGREAESARKRGMELAARMRADTFAPPNLSPEAFLGTTDYPFYSGMAQTGGQLGTLAFLSQMWPK